jgi:hypothetical protein
MSKVVSFPQAFALAKGVNHKFNAVFSGLPINTLTNPSGYAFTQPSFSTPAPNLFDPETAVFSLASSSFNSEGNLVFKNGGNLVNGPMKWTNGKSLGNWYKILNHAGFNTNGSVDVLNNRIEITCGPGTTLVNRALIHDVKFQRNGNEITENSSTVIGYLHFDDANNNVGMQAKVHVKPFNFTAISSFNKPLGWHTQFWVGFRYLHTQSIPGENSGLPVVIGPSKGFGFIGVLNGGAFNWYAVVVADFVDGPDEPGFVYTLNTNKSIFNPTSLGVTLTNGVIAWNVDGVTIGSVSIASLEALGHSFDNDANPVYASVSVLKGGNNENQTIPGSFTICVSEAAAWRQKEHVELWNNFESTDDSLSSSEIDYHLTGLSLLKKLK